MPDRPRPKIQTQHVIQRGEIIALAISSDPQSEAGKPVTIQILRAGEFVDMNGKEFDITAADLDAYIANSNLLVASEQVPVELGHPDDPGAPAAAWYRNFFKKVVDGVEWVCAEIDLTVLGAQSLADQLYKYFSANLWLDEQVICGGGFVNRPAVSGQQPVGSLAQFLQLKAHTQGGAPVSQTHKSPLAKVIELIRGLGEQIAKLEMSHEDRDTRIRKAVVAKYGDPVMDGWGGPYIVNAYDDRVIVSKDDKCFAVPYSFNDQDECVLGDAVEVEMTWTPKSATGEASLSQSNPAAIVPQPTIAPATQAQNSEGGEQPMGNLVQPTTEVVNAGAAPVVPTPVVPSTTVPVSAVNPLPYTLPDPSLSPEAQLAQAREQATLAAQEQMRDFELKLAAERKHAWEDAQAQMARKQEVVSLSTKLTSGARQMPFAAEEIEKALSKLSDADRAIVAPMLLRIQEVGLVELGERGSSGQGVIIKALDVQVKSALKAFLSTKGATVEMFFTANSHLGKPEQYDLSDFQK